MKLLTLNVHSRSGRETLLPLRDFILSHRPFAVALQECSQSIAAPAADCPPGMTIAGSGVLREDNHALSLVRALNTAGMDCGCAWLPVKLGYGRLDEGLALLFPGQKIARTDAFFLSRSRDYRFWKTRMALGAQPEGGGWFYCVHMGWWNDAEEPFGPQWAALSHHLENRRLSDALWLMGDFNSPADVRGEGYDRIRADGWHDLWCSARETRGCATIAGPVDGWPERSGLRIDHIWCSRPVPVRRACTVFDGVHEPEISDHRGVLIELSPTEPK